MANIDPRFICTSDLESYFVDNASGLPLSGGIVYFYSDVNRTVLKPVYQLSGTPGNYNYNNPLPNPCILSSSGTFQDAMGNNIVPYYYPFTGTPEDNTGVQELYYVVVLNSGFVPQFTRQAWPQSAGATQPPVIDEEVINYIPNGQFLAHNNIISASEPPTTAYIFTQVSGSITVNYQPIAQGGWNFAYSQSSTATFANSFSVIPPSGGWGMNSFPRYAFNFVCTGIGNNPQYKDLRIIWPDVNKFSSGNPPGSIPYTLFFDAKSNDGNAYTFQLYQFYYYGTGGSPGNYVENLIGNITIGPSQSFVSHNINNITFPPNEGSIGTNNNDHVGLALRGPSSGWNVQITDFLMTQGTVQFTSFPVETNAQMLSEGVAGWMPTPDPFGNDMYLPLILTPQGMIFDHSEVGTIIAKTTPTTAMYNELPCNGSTYLCGGYSSIGIPYSRLFGTLFNTTTNFFPFGAGANFSQCYVNSGLNTQIYLTSNQAGNLTHPADSGGGTATGFTFRSGANGAASVGYNAFANAAGVVTVVSTFTGATNGGALFADGAGSSTGMTFTALDTNQGGVFFKTLITNVPLASSLANGSSAGKYFTFSNTTTNYYMWFKTASETDPAPGGTGIQCDIDPNMIAIDVATAMATRLSQAQIDFITCKAASTLSPGDYFTFFTNSPSPQQVVVTYQINGVGSGPNFGAGPAYLLVNVGATDIASLVAFKTQLAINSYQFATPNLQGMFLRGNDPSGIWDLDVANRYSIIDALGATSPGTFELDQLISHNHPAVSGSFVESGAGSTFGGSSAGTTNSATGYRGGTENRPVNMSVNFFIKY